MGKEMKAKMTIHKDGSGTIQTPFDRDWVNGVKRGVYWKEREYKDGTWLIYKNAIRVLDLFEECFPDGEVDFE